MRIFINGQPDLVSPEDNAAFGRIMVELRDFLRQNGLGLVSIAADGAPVTLEVEQQWQDKPVSEISELQVQARGLIDMGTELLGTIAKAITALQTDTAAIVEALRGGQAKVEEKLKRLFQDFDGVQRGIVMVCNLTGLSLDTLKIDNTPFTQHVLQMAKTLQEVRNNLRNQDTYALSETLQYELQEQFPRWRRAAEILGEHLANLRSEHDE